MSSDAPMDPIVSKLKEAVARSKEEADASSGEKLLTQDFETAARKAAPDEFERMASLLRSRAEAIDASKPAEIPPHKFVQVNHRVDAGKFAIELQHRAGFRDYTVTVIVGLHPNAGMMLAEVPPVRPQTRSVRAFMDETGFSWRDESNGAIVTAEKIVNDALEKLSDLLIEDNAGRFNSDWDL